mmetsp:Transcript_9723/g.27096  ORF Transcript_9723/g.27096 Transcript_9723/m.27096 type:complete len:289 (-) Transcript_9723:404-1270(-)
MQGEAPVGYVPEDLHERISVGLRQAGEEPWSVQQMDWFYEMQSFNLKSASTREFLEQVERNFAEKEGTTRHALAWELQRLGVVAHKLKVERETREQRILQLEEKHYRAVGDIKTKCAAAEKTLVAYEAQIRRAAAVLKGKGAPRASDGDFGRAKRPDRPSPLEADLARCRSKPSPPQMSVSAPWTSQGATAPVQPTRLGMQCELAGVRGSPRPPPPLPAVRPSMQRSPPPCIGMPRLANQNQSPPAVPQPTTLSPATVPALGAILPRPTGADSSDIGSEDSNPWHGLE